MSKTIHFEKSIAELEAIVKQLEQGDLTLEESLKQYEKGIFLSRKCQEVLTTAEKTINKLRENPMNRPETPDELE